MPQNLGGGKMAKFGILHDYDLMANREDSAQSQKCHVCDAEPMTFQWSDYSGEGMCTRCGCAYQLKWGSEEQKTENKYPYLNIRDDVIPMMREYWNEKKSFVCYGTMLGQRPGLNDFFAWLKERHPDFK